MSKKTVCFGLIIILLFTLPVIADDFSKQTKIKLSVNGKTIKLHTSPLLIEGVPMLPMREFFEELDTKVEWYGKTKQISAYKSNMFIKLQIDNPVAYRNGKSYKLQHAPTLIDNLTYIPAKFTSESFDMSYSYDNDTISLKGRNIDKKYFFDYMEYQTKSIAEYDMTLAIPYGWHELSKNRYGIKDEYDNYDFAIKRYANKESYAIKEYKTKYKEALIQKYGRDVSFIYDSIYQTPDMTFESLGYFYNGPEKKFYDIYILESDGDFFIFEGSYATDANEQYIRDVYHKIISTIQLNSKTVQSLNEHYVEYADAFKIGLSLDEEITSNQDVYNFFLFSGKIKDTENYNGLYALVTRDNEKIYFNINVLDDGSFKTKIYTPFGIGKHNITIFSNDRKANDDKRLMKFSVVNLSNDVTKYLIPTRYARSNDTEAISLANYLTYQSTSAYLKAKVIFDYISTNIILENETLSSLEAMRDSTKVIIDKKATPLELCITTATLLRASDIPAKVVMGKGDAQQYYAVEARINGQWVIYDPISQIKTTQNPDLAVYKLGAEKTPYNHTATYFHIKLSAYKKLFISYKTLSY